MRNLRSAKQSILTGIFGGICLMGCTEDPQASRSDMPQPMDMGAQMADVSTCVAPCGAADASEMIDVAPPMESINTLTEIDAVPANAFALVSRPLIDFGVLDDGSVVVFSESGVSLVRDGDPIEWGDAYGTFRGAYTMAGEHLVFTSDGIYAIVGDELQPSPLSSVVEDIQRVVRTGPESMWMMNADTLYHWSGGVVQSLALDGVEFQWNNVQVAAGEYDGQAALWVADGSVLFALTTEDAWTFDWAEDIAWLAGSADGLWIGHGHTISQRAQDGEWTQYQRPMGAIYAAGSHMTRDIWISSGTEIWQWTGDGLRIRQDAPPHGQLKIGFNGDLYLSNRTGVFRVSAGRLVLFDGLASGDRLLSDTTVSVNPSSPEQVEEVTVEINETGPFTIQDDAWSIQLSVDELGPGLHTLRVSIQYEDGQTITGELTFSGPPTWVTDVQPLHEAYCAACHGDGGSAHPMATAEQWQIEIAAILDDIETGRMPYGQPKLDDVLVQLVRDWRDSGFTEQ